jgi:hypothetical protein
MRISFLLALITLIANPARCFGAEPCREIHGRAILYSGDSFLEIWHIGTHHTFYVVDDSSTDLILRYVPASVGDSKPALFANFTLCPTPPYRRGASQATLVKRIRNPRVATMPN